ncbi:uncharacterized protein LOC124405892 [Diprion similis]|uniref:uncharacterized protein LOC124405892 n=1 Tax=Diprion similis TaxID=362088 RepID=UPI001EF7C5E7|nr:uncharacterized protein LOC124405892 [Diprion similis]
MAGKYSGLQARIKERCEFAIFVPCAAHSLNLVGLHAAGCVPEATSLFQLVQKLYNFFSSSTYRWNLLTKCLGSNKVIKCLSETRRAARADAVGALHRSYKEILETLLLIARDTDQPGETRNEALSLTRKMEKLIMIVLTEMWSNVLERINTTSHSLQKDTLTMDVATKLFASLADFIGNVRNNFDQYESSAKMKFPDADYKDLSQRTRSRSSRIIFFEGPAQTQRSDSYKEINQRFGFLTRLKNIRSDELKNSCKEFAAMYYVDVIAEELESECLHLTHYLRNVQNSGNEEINIPELYHLLRADEIEETFPNVAITLRIFFALMVTNCSGERSFSKLSRIKNELRSTMLQERLNNLSLMSIERDVLEQIDFEECRFILFQVSLL